VNEHHPLELGIIDFPRAVSRHLPLMAPRYSQFNDSQSCNQEKKNEVSNGARC